MTLLTTVFAAVKRVERYATTCRKVESDNYLLKISGSSRFRRNPQRG